MIWNWHRNCGTRDSLLHRDMAAFAADFGEPLAARILQTSRPERTRSLPNLYLKPGNKHFRVLTLLDLAGVGRFKKQLHSFLEVPARRFNALPLAGNVQFRA